VGEEALVPERDVEEIRDGYQSGALSPVQKAILAWADVFLGIPGTLDASGAPGERREPSVRSELARHLDPAQIVEITATLALCMGFSKIAIALGPMPDDMPTLRTPMPGSESPRA